jgi:release factor glutamine methyltransferase
MSEDEIILTHILQCRPIDLAFHKPALTVTQQEQFEQFKRRRGAGEPLQYILGTCSFMGLELAVNPSVLVPRPETEQLVDAAIKYITLLFPKVYPSMSFPVKKFCHSRESGNPIKILYLGTGSGNIAIALAKFIPQSRIVSVDISAQAIKVAKANARYHGVDNRIKFEQADIMVSLRGVPMLSCESKNRGDAAISEFDLIISNPPYIPTSQLKNLPQDVQKEPAIALDGGEDGLNFYRIIIKYTPCLLRTGGCLMMEFGDGQSEAVKKLVEAQRAFSDIEIIKDLAGWDRIIRAVLSS